MTGKHLFWKLAGVLLKQKCSWHSQAVLSNVYLLNDECWLFFSFLSVCVEQIWTVSPNLFGLISPGGHNWIADGPESSPVISSPYANKRRWCREQMRNNRVSKSKLSARSVCKCRCRCWVLETRWDAEFNWDNSSISETRISQVKFWRLLLTKKLEATVRNFPQYIYIYIYLRVSRKSGNS